MAKWQRKMETSARATRDAAAPKPDADGNDVLAVVVRALLAMLLVARWLVPCESASDGGTLWLTQLTLGAGVLWAWSCFRSGEFRVKFSAIDAAFAVVVLGHVVSALSVVTTAGDKRAAINMLWEWVSLGTLFFLLRQTMADCGSQRKVAISFLSTALALAGFGIWQHYVYYPAAVREYDANRGELERLKSAPPPATQDEAVRRTQRIRDIETEFYAQGVPPTESGRQLFERRLRASREPFGFFALANSFAGLLVVGLLISLAFFVQSLRQADSRRLAVLLGAGVIVVAYCLLLTKSRTGWAGLISGLIAWGFFAGMRRRGSIDVRLLRLAMGTLAVVVVLFGLAIATGGIDTAVFLEAPKSLSYRLLYWRGAVATLRESPLLGTGPGNFRPRYLKHKLPESSEEIADPHNFVLDLWASGGLLAIAGLAAFGGVVAAHLLRRRRTGPETIPAHTPGGKAILIGAALAFPVVIVANLLNGTSMDLRLCALGVSWEVVLLLLRPALAGQARASADAVASSDECCGLSTECLAAAIVALLIHLSGAGGIEMPGIVQILVLLSLFATSCAANDRFDVAVPASNSRRGVIVAAVLIATAFIGSLFTATKPVLARSALVSAGDVAISTGAGMERAERLYTEAAAADPLSSEPFEKLAELQFSHWERDRALKSDRFEKGVELARLAIARNPYSPHGYRRLGEWLLKKQARSGLAADAEAALTELTQAVERMPNHAGLRAERAEAFQKAGRIDEARSEAAAALELDRINRQAGHIELFLPTKSERSNGANAAGRPGLDLEELKSLAGELP